jgi:hypothetical protein
MSPACLLLSCLAASPQDAAPAAAGATRARALFELRILREFVGEAAGDQLGWGIEGAGDVDGDGAIDYLITNAWSGIAGSQSGRAFLMAGKRKPVTK